MIKTSFFSSKAPREQKVSIAKWPPRFWKGQRAKLLAPSDPKASNWQVAYLHDLQTRFPDGQGLMEYLQEIEMMTPHAILCCYEQEASECHRSILAEFAKKHLGIEIKEWSNEQPSQGSLL